MAFLDYGILERRRHYCEEEVRFNRRLASSVYLGVVPVTLDGAAIRMEGQGEIVEWAVKMVRLPEEATLGWRIDRGEIGEEEMSSVARRMADFHARAEAGPAVAAFGRLDVVAANARANFAEAAGQAGVTVSEDVLVRLAELTERALAALGPAFEDRAARGVPRDGHGDLRLDHIYLFSGRPTPDDHVIVDAIEFADRFRSADPMADLAFLVMDLIFHGRRDLADVLVGADLKASGDGGVDASFRSESSRRLFLDAARRWGVPPLLLICRADPDVVRERLLGRRGDVSDADWSMYLRAAELWEPPGPPIAEITWIIDTDGGAEKALSLALDLLRSARLLGPEG